MEEEIDGILPFLDVLVRRVDDKLDFKIYRKPTFTTRFFPLVSNKKWLPSTVCAHRLTNIPMTMENYNEEKNFIVEIGRNNGYKDQEIKNIIQKHEAHQRTRNLTTHLLAPGKLSTRYTTAQFIKHDCFFLQKKS
jgi:hypothetical protein